MESHKRLSLLITMVTLMCMACTCPSPETHRKSNHSQLDHNHFLLHIWLKVSICNTRGCCFFLHHFHLLPPCSCIFLSTFKSSAMLSEDSLLQKSQQHPKAKAVNENPLTAPKGGRKLPPPPKFSNSSPSFSSTCLHED